MDFSSIAIIAAVLSLGAFTKGATGMGLPLISMPILTSTLGLAHAIGVLVIPILATNLWQALRFRAERLNGHMQFLVPMVIASFLGIGIGTAGLALVEERFLVGVLAGTILAYIALRLLRPDFTLSAASALWLSAPMGLVAGMLQGATGISSPVAATYVHAMRLKYRAHVFALSAIFFASTVAQVPALAAAGILQVKWLLEGLIALIPVALFLPLGQKVGAYIDPSVFDKVILAFLAIIGVILVSRI